MLSGVIGALVARGVPLLEAAALGAHVHGRAAALGPGEGLVACDLPDLVARVLGGRGRPAVGDGGARWVSGGARPGPTSTSARSPHNAALLAEVAAPAALCAVVKADGYGHGAVPVARPPWPAGRPGWRWPWSRRG